MRPLTLTRPLTLAPTQIAHQNRNHTLNSHRHLANLIGISLNAPRGTMTDSVHRELRISATKQEPSVPIQDAGDEDKESTPEEQDDENRSV